MHEIRGKSFFISSHNEWYIGNVMVCAHFSSKLAHVPMVYARLRS